MTKLFALAGVGIAFVIFFFFIDIKPFLKAIYEPFVDGISQLPIKAAFSGLGTGINGNYTLILSAILVFMVMALIDRVVVRRI